MALSTTCLVRTYILVMYYAAVITGIVASAQAIDGTRGPNYVINSLLLTASVPLMMVLPFMQWIRWNKTIIVVSIYYMTWLLSTVNLGINLSTVDYHIVVMSVGFICFFALLPIMCVVSRTIMGIMVLTIVWIMWLMMTTPRCINWNPDKVYYKCNAYHTDYLFTFIALLVSGIFGLFIVMLGLEFGSISLLPD